MGTPSVDVIARPSGQGLEAPRSNPALQLADALTSAQPQVQSFTDALGEQLRTQDTQKAQAAANANSGQAYKEAVRSGAIKPTQSPWFMQAYEQQAAQVRAHAAVTAVTLDSANWPERNFDPAHPTAFTDKLQAEVGKLQQGFTGLDQNKGFTQAAAPLVQETLQANGAYNTQRIQQDQIQNATSLTTQAITDALKANPKATPADLFGATEGQHKTWLSVGGTEQTWRQLVYQSFVATAANTKDGALLGQDGPLHTPYNGVTLANIAGVDGKPLGLQLDQDKFLIARGDEFDTNQDYKHYQAGIEAEGAKADAFFRQKYGNDYGFGNIPASQLRTDGVAGGFSADGISMAMGMAKGRLDAAAGYGTAQAELHSQDPEVQKKILGWNQTALTQGLTPGLVGELNEAVARGQLLAKDVLGFEDRAHSQTNFQIGENNANRREAEGLLRTDQGLALQKAALVGYAAKQSVAKATQILQANGIDYGKMSSAAKKTFEEDITNAAVANLDKGPTAAGEAADAAAFGLTQALLARHKRIARPVGNPNAK